MRKIRIDKNTSLASFPEACREEVRQLVHDAELFGTDFTAVLDGGRIQVTASPLPENRRHYWSWKADAPMIEEQADEYWNWYVHSFGWEAV